jgi:hypothetical protein
LVEVAVDFTHGTKILKVRNWDILPSNLFMHSILKKIVAQLIQQGLAPQIARSCADLFDEVEWHNAQLPLRQWMGSIRVFYHKKP